MVPGTTGACGLAARRGWRCALPFHCAAGVPGATPPEAAWHGPAHATPATPHARSQATAALETAALGRGGDAGAAGSQDRGQAAVQRAGDEEPVHGASRRALLGGAACAAGKPGVWVGPVEPDRYPLVSTGGVLPFLMAELHPVSMGSHTPGRRAGIDGGSPLLLSRPSTMRRRRVAAGTAAIPRAASGTRCLRSCSTTSCSAPCRTCSGRRSRPLRWTLARRLSSSPAR